MKKRKDDIWYHAIYIDGKRKILYSKSRAELSKKIKQFEKDLLLRGGLDTDITLFDYVDVYERAYFENLSPTTIRGYKVILQNFKANFTPKTKLKSILNSDIQIIINKFAKTHSTKSCENYVGFLNKFFAKAVTNHHIVSSPMGDITIPFKDDKFKCPVYNNDDYAKLLSVAEKIKIFSLHLYSQDFVA